jgi:hypothetical protein
MTNGQLTAQATPIEVSGGGVSDRFTPGAAGNQARQAPLGGACRYAAGGFSASCRVAMQMTTYNMVNPQGRRPTVRYALPAGIQMLACLSAVSFRTGFESKGCTQEYGSRKAVGRAPVMMAGMMIGLAVNW